MVNRPLVPLVVAVIGGSCVRHFEPKYVELSDPLNVTQHYRGREVIVTAKGNSFPKPKTRRK